MSATRVLPDFDSTNVAVSSLTLRCRTQYYVQRVRKNSEIRLRSWFTTEWLKSGCSRAFLKHEWTPYNVLDSTRHG